MKSGKERTADSQEIGQHLTIEHGRDDLNKSLFKILRNSK